MFKKEIAVEKVIDGAKFIIGVSQIVQDFLPDKLGTIVSIAGTINQMCEDYENYKALLGSFNMALINSLEILEVNQFHKNYKDALEQIEKIFDDVKTQVEIIRNPKHKITKIRNFLNSGNVKNDLQNLVEQFNVIKGIFPHTSSYDILTAISDPRAASFWNNHIGDSNSNCPFDIFKNQLNLCTDIKDSAKGLEKGSDNLIADKISKEHFNYVVSWLGGWKKFVERIKEENPFTKEFFEKMSKEIKPPMSVNIDMKEDEYDVIVKPTTTYWYSGDGKTSYSLSFIVYYKEESKERHKGHKEELNSPWKIFELEPGKTLKVNPSTTTIFKMFSVCKKKGLISNEWTERVFSHAEYKEHGKNQLWSMDSLLSREAWIIPEDVVLPASKEKRSPVFENITNRSLTDKIYNDYEIKNIRPVIYVSNAAYSLAKKLGYFFSPEILLHLWRDPKFIFKSSFVERIIGIDINVSTNIIESRKEFVYQSVLKKNFELNKVIQMRFPDFNWVPVYDESKYNEVNEKFDASEELKKSISDKCEQLSMELGSVVVEYLSNKTIVNLCAAGAQSNIHGYIGSPNVRTMKDLKSGHIIVLNQNLLGHTNTFISRVDIEGNSLNSLRETLKRETLKFTGESFYLDLAAYVRENGEHNIWTDDETKNPVPSVFLPDQISLSLIENTFIVKPEDGKNQASVDGILSWMREHPPKIPCVGSNYNTKSIVKIPTIFNTGVEFFARGDFIMELMQDNGTKPYLKIEMCSGKMTATMSSGKKYMLQVIPVKFSSILYIGYVIEVLPKYILIRSTGGVPFETPIATNASVNDRFVHFRQIDKAPVDIVNFHNINKKIEEIKEEKNILLCASSNSHINIGHLLK